MILVIAGLGFLFSIFLLGLEVLSFALWVALKLLEWFLRLGLWLLNRYAEPQGGNIVIQINIVDDDEEPPMRDVTPRRQMHRIEHRGGDII
jgi:hypothetical protein